MAVRYEYICENCGRKFATDHTAPTCPHCGHKHGQVKEPEN